MIVLLNPNSSRAVTASMAETVADLAPFEATELAGAPEGIETDAHVAEVAPMVRDFIARTEAKAVVVACFSDPGVDGPHPVRTVGIAEAAYREGAAYGRFGIVSLGPASIARHAARIEALGLTAHLAADRSIGMTVAEGLRPEAMPAIERTARLLIEDGAGAIILGCAGLGAKRAALEAVLGVPVIDPVRAGLTRARTVTGEPA